MPFKTLVANDFLDSLFDGDVYVVPTDWDVSLHTADPGETGASEVSGGTYVRQVPSFSAAGSKSKTTDAEIEFTLMPACTITHLGVWGYYTDTWVWLWGGELGSSKVVGAGDTVKIPVGDLDIDLT